MELLERHFDIAVQTPDGIDKLRSLILSLAMQGKLVPQIANEQPVSEFMKDINEEKKLLVESGKIHKQEPLKDIKHDFAPYELPKGWLWVRLGELTQKIGSGSTPRGGKNVYTKDGVPFLRSQNIWNHGIKTDDVAFITTETHKSMANTKVCPKDILLNITGASLGRSAIVPDDFDEANVSQHVTIIRLVKPESRRFLHFFILSPFCQNMIWTRQVGMAREGLSKKVLEQFEIPFPPLTEQKRIVNKIDQLMSLCDKLEAKRSEQSNKRLKIHTAAINKLLSASDKSEFNSSWCFITKNFGKLYSVSENVEELKNAILQLAVMGKLVPQDPKDQPASELLKEIEAEKKKLVKEGKIRDLTPLEPIKDVPYEIPSTWKWIRLIDIAEYNGRPNATPEEIDQDTWVLDLEDIEKDTSRIIARAKYKDRQSKSTKSTFCKGDVLYGKLRPYLNKVVVADSDGVCTTEIVPIVPYKGIDPFYLKNILMRPSFIEYVNALSYGVKMPRLGTSDAINSIHPIPPFAEQKRIVAKIDKLMSLCNTLLQHIHNSTMKQTAILNSVLLKKIN